MCTLQSHGCIKCQSTATRHVVGLSTMVAIPPLHMQLVALTPNAQMLLYAAVGGILGFSMPYGGAGAVNWATPDPGSFPPYTGALPVILSWFVSPVLTGLAACILFLAVRFLVLRRKDAYDLSFWVLPPFVPLTTWINIFFVFTKVNDMAFSSEPVRLCAGAASEWHMVCLSSYRTFVLLPFGHTPVCYFASLVMHGVTSY